MSNIVRVIDVYCDVHGNFMKELTAIVRQTSLDWDGRATQEALRSARCRTCFDETGEQRPLYWATEPMEVDDYRIGLVRPSYWRVGA